MGSEVSLCHFWSCFAVFDGPEILDLVEPFVKEKAKGRTELVSQLELVAGAWIPSKFWLIKENTACGERICPHTSSMLSDHAVNAIYERFICTED